MKSNKEIVAEFMSWFVVVGKKCLLNSDDEKVGEVLASDMAVRLAELLEAKDSATRAMIESLPSWEGCHYDEQVLDMELREWKQDCISKLK